MASKDDDVASPTEPIRNSAKPVSGDDYRRQLGERIRFLRLKHGHRQADYAKIIGVSHAQVQKYELGINLIPVLALLRLADALEISVEWLLRGDCDFPQPAPLQLLSQKEQDLLASYRLIRSANDRRFIRRIAKALTSITDADAPDTDDEESGH